MEKEIPLDLDGVVIRRKEYLSEKIARDFCVPLEDIREFFMTKYKDATIGKSGIRDTLPSI